MRIRTIRETARILKDMDPETKVTEYILRRMILEGTLPHRKTGTKYLLDVDSVIRFFEGGQINESVANI